MTQSVLTVSTLVHYLKNRLEGDPLIQGVLVEGELSNFSNYRSGHWYFSLKDETALIRCAMFSSKNKSVQFLPKDGDKVIVKGNISVFEARGEMQMIVTAMRSSTIGDLYLQFEKLKKKLYEEGLFDPSHKKSLPRYPMRIGLVTGAATAARSDVLTTVGRRWPSVEIVEYPVLVQGKESAGQIISALLKADKEHLDLILLVRGGGSIEDLWSFNDEGLARVIYQLNTPVVTGIGHEINYTIADYVADVRAPTPTGAAEIATPDLREVLNHIHDSRDRIIMAMVKRIQKEEQKLDLLENSRIFQNPLKLCSEKKLQLQHLSSRFARLMNTKVYRLESRLSAASSRLAASPEKRARQTSISLQEKNNRLERNLERILADQKNHCSRSAGLLDAYSPLKILSRGYAVVTKEGNTVRLANQLEAGNHVDIRFHEGIARALITETERKE